MWHLAWGTHTLRLHKVCRLTKWWHKPQQEVAVRPHSLLSPACRSSVEQVLYGYRTFPLLYNSSFFHFMEQKNWDQSIVTVTSVCAMRSAGTRLTLLWTGVRTTLKSKGFRLQRGTVTRQQAEDVWDKEGNRQRSQDVTGISSENPERKWSEMKRKIEISWRHAGDQPGCSPELFFDLGVNKDEKHI